MLLLLNKINYGIQTVIEDKTKSIHLLFPFFCFVHSSPDSFVCHRIVLIRRLILRQKTCNHLVKKETYKELTELEAVVLNEKNFRQVCKVFNDKPQEAFSEEDHEFFIESIHGKVDGFKRMHPKDSLYIPSFQAMLKMMQFAPKIAKYFHWATQDGAPSVYSEYKCYPLDQPQPFIHDCTYLLFTIYPISLYYNQYVLFCRSQFTADEA